MYSVKSNILSTIEDNPCVIIVGETGSGKTTQIPQFVYSHFSNSKSSASASSALGKEGFSIAITQPRRVAAITLAQRVSSELRTEIGGLVGYSVRFDDKSSYRTKIKFLTDGMLLRETMLDPLLSKYNLVFLDEAHERTVQTDVLFSLLKKIQKIRNSNNNNNNNSSNDKINFRLVIMSATLESQKFSKYFSYAPILHISGRQFPVQIYNLSLIPSSKKSANNNNNPNPNSKSNSEFYSVSALESDYFSSVITTILQIHIDPSLQPPGDILVFLTGQEEINECISILQSKTKLLPPTCPQFLLIPLYAALTPSQQSLAFSPTPKGFRKIIVSTNIAETSITIPGIKYVVDCGKVKIRSYNSKLGLEVLEIVKESRGQARQRSGRAGRESEGKCWRIFGEGTWDREMQEAATPEIQRVNISAIILQLAALKLNLRRNQQQQKSLTTSEEKNNNKMSPKSPRTTKLNVNTNNSQMEIKLFDRIRDLEWMDSPDPVAVNRAMELLKTLGALIPESEELTIPLGEQMSVLPLEPMYSKLLLSSVTYNCSEEILIIVSMLNSANNNNLFRSKNTNNSNSEEGGRSISKESIVKREIKSECGDHLTLYWIYKGFDEACVKEGGTNNNQGKRNETKKNLYCKELNLNKKALENAKEIKEQLEKYFEQLNLPIVSCFSKEFEVKPSTTTTNNSKKNKNQGIIIKENQSKEEQEEQEEGTKAKEKRRKEIGEETVLKCLVSAFFINAAVRQEDGSFRTLLGNKIVAIHPGSTLFRPGSKPNSFGALPRTRSNVGLGLGGGSLRLREGGVVDCVIYDELVMTKKKYMRTVSKIERSWLTTLAPDFYTTKK